jgi:hypothetical protein
MTKLTYIAEPEALRSGAWVAVPPEEARRWAVYRIAWLPQKRGQSRPAPKRRLLATFFGPDAEACAFKLAARSTSLAGRRPPASKPKPPALYRSLTRQQWEAAQDERNWK